MIFVIGFLVLSCTSAKINSASSSSQKRKISSDCNYQISEFKNFSHLPNAETKNQWVTEVCRRQSHQLAKQCNLGIPSMELKRNCQGVVRPIQESESSPLLKNGPEKLTVVKSFSEEGDTEEEAEQKIQNAAKEQVEHIRQNLKKFSDICLAKGGVPLTSLDSSQPIVKEDPQATSFVREMTLHTRASCHEKLRQASHEFEAQIDVRFWK